MHICRGVRHFTAQKPAGEGFYPGVTWGFNMATNNKKNQYNAELMKRLMGKVCMLQVLCSVAWHLDYTV